MRRIFLFPLIAVFTFSIGITATFIFLTPSCLLKQESDPQAVLFSNTKIQLNGNLEAYHVGSVELGNVTIEKFFVINKSPEAAVYMDYGTRGLKNQTRAWFRKQKGGKQQYIGKSFCGVGLEKVNFDKKLLSGESTEFEVEVYDEKSLRYDIGFSFWTDNKTKEKIIWAAVDKRPTASKR